MAVTGKTVTATGLIESIGVNTHVPYTDGNYSDLALIRQNLTYLGLDQVRDQITNGEAGTPSVQAYQTLASEGVKFTIYIQSEGFVGGGKNSDEAYVDRQLALANSLPAGSVTAIEGPNEVNNQPFTWTKNDGTVITNDAETAAIDEQRTIVTDIKNYANIARVPVDYFTGYNEGGPTATDTGSNPDPVSTGLATYDNQHPYPGVSAPATALLRSIALSNTTNANEPAVYTETGYATNDVGEVVQAKYTLDLIMDAVSDNIAKTFIYELMDAYPAGDGRNSSRGLFAYSGNNYGSNADTAKGAAVAIHNLTSLIGDNGNTFTPTPLSYTVSNLPTTGNTMAIQESNGDYFVVVWAEPSITASSPTGPSQNATITVTTPGYTAKAIYDPLGTDGLGTGGLTPTTASGTSVTVGVSDHPILVEFQQSIPVCFQRGTRILTSGGDVAVEELRIGDRLVTHSGAIRPIKWIGRRSYSGALMNSNPDLAPVCFKAGSLADYIPKRDLWVSAPHTMFIDGVLIPAGLLVNGQSITRHFDLEEVQYFHVELETHDVLFAEGAPSESFYDQDGRGMFHNAAEFLDLYPAAEPGEKPTYFAPRLEEGFELEAIRESLLGRASRLNDDGSSRSVDLRGRLEIADRTAVSGWAQDLLSPDRPIGIVALCNGVEIARLCANQYRQDLAQAGIGDGRHAFELKWSTPFAPGARHEVELRYCDTWEQVEGSPLIVEAQEAAVPAFVGDLLGHVDVVSYSRITGWAVDADYPDRAVGLVVSVDNVVVARILANRRRDDLIKQSIGSGRHAFEFDLPAGLSLSCDHMISVQREIDRAHLPNSPRRLSAIVQAEPRPLKDVLAEVMDARSLESDPVRAMVLLNELSSRLTSQGALKHESIQTSAPLRRAG